MPLSNPSMTQALRAPLFKRFGLGEFPDDFFKTGTAAAGAVTTNARCGLITSEALTTAAGAAYTLTITNDQVHANAVVLVTIEQGTNTGGTPTLGLVTPAAGSVVIIVRNTHATTAFNGTIKARFHIVNPA